MMISISIIIFSVLSMPRVLDKRLWAWIHLIYFPPLLLFAGCICDNPTTETTKTIPTTEEVNSTDQNPASPKKYVVTTTPTTPTDSTCQDLKPVMQYRSQPLIVVNPVDTSRIVLEGNPATLECQFKAPEEAEATVLWKRSCSPNCSISFDVSNTTNRIVSANVAQGWSKLSFHSTQKNDTGMYYCFVVASIGHGKSCGTFLWVRSEYEPYPTKG